MTSYLVKNVPMEKCCIFRPAFGCCALQTLGNLPFELATLATRTTIYHGRRYSQNISSCRKDYSRMTNGDYFLHLFTPHVKKSFCKKKIVTFDNAVKFCCTQQPKEKKVLQKMTSLKHRF